MCSTFFFVDAFRHHRRKLKMYDNGNATTPLPYTYQFPKLTEKNPYPTTVKSAHTRSNTFHHAVSLHIYFSWMLADIQWYILIAWRVYVHPLILLLIKIYAWCLCEMRPTLVYLTSTLTFYICLVLLLVLVSRNFRMHFFCSARLNILRWPNSRYWLDNYKLSGGSRFLVQRL